MTVSTIGISIDYYHASYVSVVTVSVPATNSVSEVSGTVQVCATLSGVSGSLEDVVTITLATNDGMYMI